MIYPSLEPLPITVAVRTGRTRRLWNLFPQHEVTAMFHFPESPDKPFARTWWRFGA